MSPLDEMAKLNHGGIFGIGDLRDIWREDELNILLDRRLTNEEIAFIRDGLIRTISLLNFMNYNLTRLRQQVEHWIKNSQKFDDNLPTLGRTGLSWPEKENFQIFLNTLPKFAAPVLEEGFDTKLKLNEVMPFEVTDDKPDIVSHHIVNGHLKRLDGSVQRQRVIRKRLDTAQSRSEIDILRYLRDRLPTNIQICTCICLVESNDGETTHSLSLYAEYGDLEGVMKSNISSEKCIIPCLGQLKGVAEALQFLHDKLAPDKDSHYCHLDLKPHNIVVFGLGSEPLSCDNVGIWKIIDFGISKVSKSHKTLVTTILGKDPPYRVTHTVSTTTQQIGGIYQAPEVNYQNEKQMGRRSDIWSLGCIMAEILAASLGTLTNLREKMIQNRTAGHRLMNGNQSPYVFYEGKKSCICFLDESGFRVHKTLIYELNEMTRRGNPAFHEVLTECKGLIEKMVVIKRKKRMRSEHVVETLNHILEIPIPENETGGTQAT
ncbi:kinase-like protein, partial [Daldinia eschscholtzii]